MAHRRSESLKELILLQDQMGRYLASDAATSARMWTPVVDLFETDKNIFLNAELPGMNEKELLVEVNDNVVTLEGERKFKGVVEEKGFLCLERNYGKFKRSFRLPSPIIKDNVQAEFKLGVLKITMPKGTESRPKKIKVKQG